MKTKNQISSTYFFFVLFLLCIVVAVWFSRVPLPQITKSFFLCSVFCLHIKINVTMSRLHILQRVCFWHSIGINANFQHFFFSSFKRNIETISYVTMHDLTIHVFFRFKLLIQWFIHERCNQADNLIETGNDFQLFQIKD